MTLAHIVLSDAGLPPIAVLLMCVRLMFYCSANNSGYSKYVTSGWDSPTRLYSKVSGSSCAEVMLLTKQYISKTNQFRCSIHLAFVSLVQKVSYSPPCGALRCNGLITAPWGWRLTCTWQLVWTVFVVVICKCMSVPHLIKWSARRKLSMGPFGAEGPEQGCKELHWTDKARVGNMS